MTPKEFYWLCRSGEQPIIIDCRLAVEFKLYHIIGALNFPHDTFKVEDIADIPLRRPVYIYG